MIKTGIKSLSKVGKTWRKDFVVGFTPFMVINVQRMHYELFKGDHAIVIAHSLP